MKLINENLQWRIHGVALYPMFPHHWIVIGIKSGFCGGRKPGEPAKDPRCRDENEQQTQRINDVNSSI